MMSQGPLNLSYAKKKIQNKNEANSKIHLKKSLSCRNIPKKLTIGLRKKIYFHVQWSKLGKFKTFLVFL